MSIFGFPSQLLKTTGYEKGLISMITFLLISNLPVYAQFKQIAEGPKFEEPDKGHLRIIQLKNGNTIYFHLTPKDGVNLRLYDVSHKEKISTNFDLGIDRVKLPQRKEQ
ncbi:MAG: hypothetical protein IPL50_04415 [Chitinophagaceae bacterium]|nr:hypothetical protein [Chitinophagaceae bacterium]